MDEEQHIVEYDSTMCFILFQQSSLLGNGIPAY